MSPAQIKEFGERPRQGLAQADLLQPKKTFGDRNGHKNQAQFLKKKQESSLLGDFLSFPWSSSSHSTSSDMSAASNHKTKEFGEHRFPPNARKQESFISPSSAESTASAVAGPSPKAHSANNTNNSSPNTSTTKTKEFGERVVDGKPTVMQKQLQQAAAANKPAPPPGSPHIRSPTTSDHHKKQPQQKQFGEQQRRGNEGWTQDKYLMTIQKNDHPNEKERKLQLEKHMQKEIMSNHFSSIMPSSSTPSSSSSLSTKPSSSPPKQQNNSQTTTPPSPPSPFNNNKDLSSLHGMTMKEFGARMSNDPDILQQDQFLSPIVAQKGKVAAVQPQSPSKFRLTSILPKSLIPNGINLDHGSSSSSASSSSNGISAPPSLWSNSQRKSSTGSVPRSMDEGPQNFKLTV